MAFAMGEFVISMLYSLMLIIDQTHKAIVTLPGVVIYRNYQGLLYPE